MKKKYETLFEANRKNKTEFRLYNVRVEFAIFNPGQNAIWIIDKFGGV